MTNEEYIKELKELYEQAKKANQNAVAHELLQEIRDLEDLEDDPCGAEDFRKQADDKE